MKEYEITYLVDPSLAEEARIEAHSAIDGVIEKAKGEISANTESNRRRLAYPIKKQALGFARTVQATVEANKIDEIRDVMRKTNGIMRVTVIQTNRREQVAANVLDEIIKPKEKKAAPAEKEAKPTRKLTDKEVEERIEKALDEEVK